MFQFDKRLFAWYLWQLNPHEFTSSVVDRVTPSNCHAENNWYHSYSKFYAQILEDNMTGPEGLRYFSTIRSQFWLPIIGNIGLDEIFIGRFSNSVTIEARQDLVFSVKLQLK